MIKFTLEKCKTKATYSAKLPQDTKLDLKKIKETFDVSFDTPILLIIKINDVELIVHGFGELLFKRCENIELMRKIAQRVYEVGLHQ